MELIEGLYTTNGFDSRKEEMRLIARDDSQVNEKVVKESLPYMQGDHDFSDRLGSRMFDNRSPSWTFKVMYKNYEQRKVIQTKIQNRLFGLGKTRFYDTAKPGYYWYGKVSEVDVEDVHTKSQLVITVTLDAYPFIISIRPEGHDIWDEFNFELDVAQPVKHSLTVSWDNFKELSVGDKMTVASWATTFDGGEKIPTYVIGAEYTVKNKRPTNSSKSRYAYQFGDTDHWVVEQDILQTQTEYLEFDLLNPGIATLTPVIEVSRPVTILTSGLIYSLKAGKYTSLSLQLKPGDTSFEVYGMDGQTDIEFKFYKELI